MKKCCKCKEDKKLSEFGIKKRNKDGLQSRCKVCQREYHKEIYKNSESRRQKIRDCNRRAGVKTRDYVREFKEGKACHDCGIEYPHYVMDFDHLGDKSFNIADVTYHAISLERIQKEIDKCEIVCSNCHRIRTYNRIHNGSQAN